jgi:hypothetical protein
MLISTPLLLFSSSDLLLFSSSPLLLFSSSPLLLFPLLFSSLLLFSSSRLLLFSSSPHLSIFPQIRSAVAGNLYDDVFECFDWLAGHGLRIGVLTNGNADIMETASNARFSAYLSLCLHAGQLGVLKPAAMPFVRLVCCCCGCCCG